ASSCRSPTTTRAPFSTNRRGVAAPLPLAPPVTLATLPSGSPIRWAAPPAQPRRGPIPGVHVPGVLVEVDRARLARGAGAVHERPRCADPLERHQRVHDRDVRAIGRDAAPAPGDRMPLADDREAPRRLRPVALVLTAAAPA